jgi:CubicO group peptidase (beta-lactamase class C family)
MKTADPSTVHGVCEPEFDAVTEAFATNLTERGDLGARVCVIHDGKVVVDQWGGWADRARTVPWTGDTLTNMWSSTKGVVALAAQMLVDGAGWTSCSAPAWRGCRWSSRSASS